MAQGLKSRKNRLPVGGFTMMNLFVPLSVTVSEAATQSEEFKPAVCCSVKPIEGDSHETIAVLVEVR